MRHRRPAALLAFGAALALVACAAPPPAAPPAPPPQAAPAPPPANVVLLLADPDGTVGRVTVANEGGSSTLEQAGSAVRVADGRTAPTRPQALSAEETAALFGDALGAQPAPPQRFLLYFEHNSTVLTADSLQELPSVVAAIRGRAAAETSVVGHSDTAGDAKKNLDLSLARARAVGALLAAEGVDGTAIEITSHGEANPLVPTGDNVSEPRNRRVEVTVR